MSIVFVLQSLGVLLGLQCILVLWRPSGSWARAHELTSLAGLSIALLVSALSYRGPEAAFFGGLLFSNSLFRLVICGSLLVALVVNRMLAFTHRLPPNRKPECFLFLTMICIWAFVLWFSTGVLSTYFCLVGLGITGLFAVGLAFSDRSEGEALLKYWYQLVIAALVILISLLAVAIFAGDFSFRALSAAFVGASQIRVAVIFLLLVLPYLLIGGIFPFHFNIVDRDHGSPWAVQAMNTLMISGAIYGGLIKIGMELFGGAHAPIFALRFFVCLGFVGTFWGLLGALTQENTKRKLALFSVGAFSFPFMVLGAPSATAISAAVFRLVFSSLALAALYWVLGWYHERLRNDDGSVLAGLGRHRLGAGLLLTVGICYFLSVPLIAGFSTVFSLFGAAFHAGSLVVLLGIFAVSLLAALIMLRLLALVFFERARGPAPPVDESSLLCNFLDRLIGASIFMALLVGGIGWSGVWGGLMKASAAFIQLY